MQGSFAAVDSNGCAACHLLRHQGENFPPLSVSTSKLTSLKSCAPLVVLLCSYSYLVSLYLLIYECDGKQEQRCIYVVDSWLFIHTIAVSFPFLLPIRYLCKDFENSVCAIINSAHWHGCKEGSRGETTDIRSKSYLPTFNKLDFPNELWKQISQRNYLVERQKDLSDVLFKII